jgi:hypothetical protein
LRTFADRRADLLHLRIAGVHFQNTLGCQRNPNQTERADNDTNNNSVHGEVPLFLLDKTANLARL